MTRNLLATTILAAACVAAGPALAQQDTQAGDDLCRTGLILADIDDDGTLSDDEIVTLTDTEFRQLDKDADGVVSREEFVSCHASWLEMHQDITQGQQAALDGEDAATESAEPGMDELDMVMDELDTDDNGVLSPDEYLTGAADTAATMRDGMEVENAQSTSTGTSGEASQGVEDGAPEDQIVVLRRIVVMPPQHTGMVMMSPEEAAARAAMRYIILDTDRDNQISREEWTAQGKDSGDAARTYLESSFDAMDTDKSGDVTQQEYYQQKVDSWERANLSAENKGTMDRETGGPIIYFRFPHAM